MSALLSLKRALDLAPPADGRCPYERRVHVQETFGPYGEKSFREFDEVMRCQDEWHHDGAHWGHVRKVRPGAESSAPGGAGER